MFKKILEFFGFGKKNGVHVKTTFEVSGDRNFTFLANKEEKPKDELVELLEKTTNKNTEGSPLDSCTCFNPEIKKELPVSKEVRSNVSIPEDEKKEKTNFYIKKWISTLTIKELDEMHACAVETTIGDKKVYATINNHNKKYLKLGMDVLCEAVFKTMLVKKKQKFNYWFIKFDTFRSNNIFVNWKDEVNKDVQK